MNVPYARETSIEKKSSIIFPVGLCWPCPRADSRLADPRSNGPFGMIDLDLVEDGDDEIGGVLPCSHDVRVGLIAAGGPATGGGGVLAELLVPEREPVQADLIGKVKEPDFVELPAGGCPSFV